MEDLLRRHLWFLVFPLVLEFGVKGGGCLRGVSLTVNPPAVQRGHHASLLCLYDLEGAALYSVKFYRGRLEFYRYSPGETPAFKEFRFSWIHVDLKASNDSQVVLRQIGFNLSGNFSCEVTVEAPSFSTATVYTHLLVVELPRGPPEIHTEHELESYTPGALLKANCTSPPSRPPVSLTFLLNNIPVNIPDVRQVKAGDSLQSSALSLSMKLLPSHYINGQLVLKCTALLTSLYRKTSQVTLGTRPKEPVPERVTSPNTSMRPTSLSFALYVIVCWCVTR